MSITFPHRETAESLLFAFQEEGKKCKIHPDLLWYHVNNAAINSDASDLVKRVKKLAGQLAWTKARFLASYFLNYPSFTIEETIKTNKNLPNLTEDELENQID